MLTPRMDFRNPPFNDWSEAMTELERARAHLRICQEHLKWARADTAAMASPPTSDFLTRIENHVLAALSWVWEVQEKERFGNAGDVLTIEIGAMSHEQERALKDAMRRPGILMAISDFPGHAFA